MRIAPSSPCRRRQDGSARTIGAPLLPRGVPHAKHHHGGSSPSLACGNSFIRCLSSSICRRLSAPSGSSAATISCLGRRLLDRTLLRACARRGLAGAVEAAGRRPPPAGCPRRPQCARAARRLPRLRAEGSITAAAAARGAANSWLAHSGCSSACTGARGPDRVRHRGLLLEEPRARLSRPHSLWRCLRRRRSRSWTRQRRRRCQHRLHGRLPATPPPPPLLCCSAAVDVSVALPQRRPAFIEGISGDT